MFASNIDAPTDRSSYAYEFKWDGYRAIASWNGRAFRLTSRNLLDLTKDFPGIAALAGPLARLGPTVLDGEIVVFDEKGRPHFNRLQNSPDRAEAIYMIFDVLYARGKNLMSLPYQDRRKILEQLKLKGRKWSIPPAQAGAHEEMLEVAQRMGYEGIIAKRLTSPYRPGERTGEWVKIKFAQRQEFVIGGWLPGEGLFQGTLGSLLLGFYDGQKLIFAGKVGTGFSRAERDDLHSVLRRIPAPTSQFDTRVPFRGATFVYPRLVCEVEFFEWTPDGRARHPVFKGLRTDKAPAEVIREPVPSH